MYFTEHKIFDKYLCCYMFPCAFFPSVWWLRMKQQWTFAWRFLYEHMFLFICLFKFVFLLYKFLSVETLDCILSIYLIQKRNCQTFSKISVTILLFNCQCSGWGRGLVAHGSFCPWLYFCQNSRYAMEFIFVSACRLPVATAFEHYSVCLYDVELWSLVSLIVSLPI